MASIINLLHIGVLMANSSNSEPSLDFESISVLIPPSREGDPDAQEKLMRQMQDYIDLMAERHMDKALQQKLGPSDVVQQTLTQVIENFEQFRGGTAAEFRAWLKTIIVNEMAKMRRGFRADKRNIQREQPLDAGYSGEGQMVAPTDSQPTPSSEAISAERIESFYLVMKQLPKDYARVIQLRSIDQCSFKEISEQMGRSHDAVTKLWYRAILKFEEKLRETEDFKSWG